MTKQPSPRLEAFRAMREKEYAEIEQTERDLRVLQKSLHNKTREAVAKADAAFIRRKAKKAKRASR